MSGGPRPGRPPDPTDDSRRSGGNLAALITYYGFLSLFPLLLGFTILGILLSGDPGAQRAVLDSALSQFPVIGPQLQEPSRIGGGVAGLLVGGFGALCGGLGVASAAQNAMNTAWTVPKNNRPNPIQVRGRGILLLSTVGVAILGTSVLSALGSGAGTLGAGLRVLVVVASVALNAAVFVLAFRIATTRHLTARDVAPGALAAASSGSSSSPSAPPTSATSSRARAAPTPASRPSWA